MLSLPGIHSLIAQVLQVPELHTVILSTSAGHLVSVATDQYRPKDEIHIVVGLSGEVWHETQENTHGMVDSELGRILVLPVDEPDLLQPPSDTYQPLMLLTLWSTDRVPWKELQDKGEVLSNHLAKTLSRYRDHLAVPRPPPITTLVSPAPVPTQ